MVAGDLQPYMTSKAVADGRPTIAGGLRMAATAPQTPSNIVDLAAFRRAQASRQPAAPKPVPVVGGGAWYHEAAIRDDDRTRGR